MGLFNFKKTKSNKSKSTKNNKKAVAKAKKQPAKPNNTAKTKTTNNVKSEKPKTKKVVPAGRTLNTYDNFLTKNSNSSKKRPVVVIESNSANELAVVPLSTQKGKNRTHLPNYQKGESYFKHFVEIEDNEGNPIKVNDKFKENHKNQDVSQKDVKFIRKTVFTSSKPAPKNKEKIEKFRNKKNPQG